jgi:hypothetical protein
MTPYAPQLWRKKMANRDSNTNEPTSTIALEPLHQPFSWLPSNIALEANARFAADVKSVTHGGHTIANLIRSNSMAPDHGVAPLLSGNDLDCLVGLLIYSLDTLNQAAEEYIDRMDVEARKGAK